MTPRQRRVDEWTSIIGRPLGLVMLVAFAIVWVVTRDVEPILVASAAAIYGIGQGAEALSLLRRPPQPPPPAPPPTPAPAPPTVQREEP